MVRGRLGAGSLAMLAGIGHSIAGVGGGGDVHCRFTGGVEAVYRLSADRAGVQRIDVEPSRWGRVDAGARSYRFIFDGGLERYRIVLIIDRATGDARRVYGREAAMTRPFAGHGSTPGRLVRETGGCELPGRDRIDD